MAMEDLDIIMSYTYLYFEKCLDHSNRSLDNILVCRYRSAIHIAPINYLYYLHRMTTDQM